MSNYHGEIMSIPTRLDAAIEDQLQARTDTGLVMAYKIGHRDARHAAAEIAIEADQRIVELEAQLAATKHDFAQLRIFAADLHDIACNGHLDPDLLAMRGVSWVTGSYSTLSPEEVEKAYKALEKSGA